MDGLFQDVQHAFRKLHKNSGVAAAASFTLAFGIAATTAVFSLTYTVLLRPLPFPNGERLVRVFSSNPASGAGETNVSYDDFKDLQQQSQSFAHMAAYATGGAFLTGDGSAERVGAIGVTGDFFAALGSRPVLGRVLTAADQGSGAAVISYSLWQRRYGGRVDILGHRLNFNSTTASVVGVMPLGFDYPGQSDLWTVGVDTSSPRASRSLSVIGRLRSGVGLRQASTELADIATRLSTAYPESDRDWQIRLVSLRDLKARGGKPALLMSFAAAFLLLFIACANVGILQLVRAAARRQEIAMRRALGAGRSRIVRLLLFEGLLLSLVGAVFGLFLTFLPIRFLFRSGILCLAGITDIPIYPQALGFAAIVCIAATVMFSVVPLRYSLAVEPVSSLANRTTMTDFSVRRVHAWLAAGQLSIVLVLLTIALMLTTSFVNVLRVDLGFEPKGVLTGRLAYFDDQRRLGFFQSVLDRLGAVPGVQDVSASYSLPLDPSAAYFRPAIVKPQKSHEAYDQPIAASYQLVWPGYFRVLRMSLIKGRVFTHIDDQHAPPVAIINQALARRAWPNGRAVGQQIICCEDSQPREIVGVVHDLKSESPELPPAPEIYVPFVQDSQVSMRILVRTQGDPERLIPEVRSAIASVDTDWPLYDVRTMEGIYESAIAPRRSQLVLIGAFAGIAFVLCIVGTYGIFAYAATDRLREFAIRIAFGATHKDVLWLAVRDGLLVTAFGICLGLAGVVVSASLWSSLLFAVQPLRPIVLAGTSLLLGAAATLACYIPARRATRIDPLVALRYW
jgi:putative ABC transport system permease protein